MSDYSKKKQEYRELIIFSLILFGIYLTSLYSYLLFHTIAELFSIIVAGGIFVICWNSRKNIDNSFFLVVGISFFYVSVIDLIHTLAYTGLNIFVGYDSNLPTSLWIAARFLQAFSLLYASLVVNKKVKVPFLLIGYTFITFLLVIFIFAGIFPICYIEGSGLTPFKIISEYVINLILFITILIMYKHRSEFDKKILILIISSILATMIGELAFTFYVSVYGISNLIGHIFKIIAYFFLYKAIIEIGLENPFNLLFKKLKDSEEKYRLIVENAHEGIWTIDNKAYTTFVNQRMVQILGYSLEEMMGKHLFEFMNEDSIEIAKNNLDRRKRGIEERHDFEFLRKDGTMVYTRLDTSPLLDDDGNYIGALALVADITERRKADEKIANLAKFPSENPSPVIRVNNENIIYSNKVGEHIFKISKGSPLPKVLKDDIIEVISNKKLKTIEREIENKFYSFVITPVEGATYVNIYGMDITERKQAERRLEHLISTVSHELRTPITVLLMSLDYLKNHKDNITPELELRLMDGITRNISLLHKLAEDILMVSRIDEKRLELDWLEYSPLEIINEILTLMEPIGKNRNITIEVDLDENIRLLGDPKRIDQVFRILIDNAIKYSEPDSKIEIKGIENYKGKFNTNHQMGVLFQFKDYGVGISEKDRSHLFERFFRSEQVKEISGTGLGLSIARELTHLHSGEIFVETEFEKGSTFFVFLPRIEG